jgi:hypothetical protein
MANRRTSRDEWRKRVERWRDSGLTAKDFAAETGINAGTLQFWKYKLGKQEERSPRRSARNAVAAIASSLVEVRPVSMALETRFEIELVGGRRVHVPAVFDPAALKSLLAVVEAA